jgi:glycosyltransferase involved in cell wall biosynthesis
MPKVSVIMPVKNGKSFLSEAIESILAQTFSNFEFIIVDDASTDNSSTIVRQYKDDRILLVTSKNHLGLTASLNKALKQAKGEYIARMDADDISLPERLQRQVEVLDADAELKLCGSWVELIDKKGIKIGERKYPVEYDLIQKDIMRYNPFVHPSIMMKKNILSAIGHYDEGLDGAEDYDLFLRIVKKYKSSNIPAILLKYRLGSHRVSHNQLKKLERAALRTRIKALTDYKYPLWQSIYLLKPLISHSVPATLKHKFIRS